MPDTYSVGQQGACPGAAPFVVAVVVEVEVFFKSIPPQSERCGWFAIEVIRVAQTIFLNSSVRRGWGLGHDADNALSFVLVVGFPFMRGAASVVNGCGSCPWIFVIRGFLI